jgi:predicted acetyltransferase
VTDELELRTATDGELTELFTFIVGAFLEDADDESIEVERMVWEPERFHVITDGGRHVGGGGVLTRELTVPGTVVSAAHVTAVAVAATHRRQGLLTRIMKTQLEAVRDRGTEPIAVLWASEAAIYGRFGYGAAASHVEYTIPVLETALPGTSAGRMRQVKPSEATDQFSRVYEQVRADRPGVSGRPGRWWEHLMADPKERRRGASALRGAVYEVEGEPVGYTLWRVKSGWGDAGPNGEVLVREVVAITAEAYAALWRFLLSIDLARTVKYPFAARDEALPFMLTNQYALTASISPSLWVRIVDVPGALAARRYATAVDVVLEVTDDLLPDNAGCWHLVGDPASAKCEATTADPDLTLNVRDLGAAYLGGTSLHQLATAGLVAEHRRGVLAGVSTAFGWYRAPASIEIF